MNSTIKKMLMNIWITIGQKLYKKKKNWTSPTNWFFEPKKRKSPVNQNTNIYIYIYIYMRLHQNDNNNFYI